MFGGDTVPQGIPFLAAIDWFIGSLRTVTNITGDSVVCALVATLCPIENEHGMEDMMKAAKLDVVEDSSESNKVSSEEA